jgi:hypothetical protein
MLLLSAAAGLCKQGQLSQHALQWAIYMEAQLMSAAGQVQLPLAFGKWQMLLSRV